MASHRKTYDTLVITLFILGKEHILPIDFINSIPPSTRYGWRNSATEKFIGFEFRDDFKQELKRLVLFKKYKHLKKVFTAVQHIYIALADFIELVRYKLHDVKQYRECVCDLIRLYSTIIPAEKIRQAFGISIATHQRWLFEIKTRCQKNFSGLCFATSPNQLSRPEQSIIKKFLLDPAFAHWPVCSIALYCLREGIVSCSIATWYHYRKLFNIVRKRYRSKPKRESLRSDYVNQYWHMDVTKIQTSDLVWHYLYMIRDHFSGRILASKRENKISMYFSKALIAQAYQEAKSIFTSVDVSLIVDNGVENQNHLVDEFVLSTNGQIEKKTALKNFNYSNSAIESVFYSLKNFYLRPEDLKNGNTLDARIHFFVNDTNSVRPAIRIRGHTPDEIFFSQIQNLDFKTKIKEAIFQRVQYNRNKGCDGCEVKLSG
jgi:putative transposase